MATSEKVLNTSLDQRLLLEKINQYSEANRRTDKLSVCMQQFGERWDTSHTAFIGLQLRALGWVTTFKDTHQYALWNMTPLGKAALLEIRSIKQAEATAALNKAVDNGKYAVFSESDSGWQQCIGKDAATALADKWIKEGDEDEVVHVVQIVKSLKVKRVVEEV